MQIKHVFSEAKLVGSENADYCYNVSSFLHYKHGSESNNYTSKSC